VAGHTYDEALIAIGGLIVPLPKFIDDDAMKILGNIRSAIAPNGKLLLLESAPPERASGQTLAC
jgi:hypothetical protein